MGLGQDQRLLPLQWFCMKTWWIHWCDTWHFRNLYCSVPLRQFVWSANCQIDPPCKNQRRALEFCSFPLGHSRVLPMASSWPRLLQEARIKALIKLYLSKNT